MNAVPNTLLPITHLLYLHGFRSSPHSAKARQVADRVAAWNTAQPGPARPRVTWSCPQLPPSPRGAIAVIEQHIADWPRDSMAVIGSSLGGFYATWVAEHTGCKAVLLNPAVDPARDLAKHLGVQTSWHDPLDTFVVHAGHLDELRALECPALTHPAQYFCVIAQGDEVLDWREMSARYADTLIKLLPGSDHGLSDFDDHIDEVFGFLGLP